MARLVAAHFLVWVSIAGAADPAYLSAAGKMALIESGQPPAGSRVFLSAHELNAWSKVRIQTVVPDGLRGSRLELGEGTAAGFAWVDFLKLQRAKGGRPSWLLARLLEGERPVRVAVRIQSGHGHATVDVERAEISGVTVRGQALDFLISNFLLPYYPDAAIGRPFELGHRIDRLEISQAGVVVVIGK